MGGLGAIPIAVANRLLIFFFALGLGVDLLVANGASAVRLNSITAATQSQSQSQYRQPEVSWLFEG